MRLLELQTPESSPQLYKLLRERKPAIIVFQASQVGGDQAGLMMGDVTDRVQLTPVAIHEAMCFIETEFRGNPVSPDHDLIATAVEARPEELNLSISDYRSFITA